MDAHASFAAWVAALNHPREHARLEAAVHPLAQIDRHPPHARGEAAGMPAEVFRGIGAIGAWLGRLERPTTFALIGAPRADGDAWTIEYALETAGFDNGGLWVARFADDGRISHLSHRPFPVPERYQQG